MYKYKFRELAKNKKVKGIITRIQEWCDVHYRTAVNWSRIKTDDKESIPGDALRIIAHNLDCTIEDLYHDKEILAKAT